MFVLHFWQSCLKQADYWMILLKKIDNESKNPFNPTIVPANWNGLKSCITEYYPLALENCNHHWDAIISSSIETFEKAAGFKFITAMKDVHGQSFMNYTKFCLLSKPVQAWQVRFFLYCELRIFELFNGDGFTYGESGEVGEKEYISPNFKLSDMNQDDIIVVPLQIDIPEHVHIAAPECNNRK